MIEPILIETPHGTVSAEWDHADTPTTVIVLAHGAGGTLATPQLRSVAAGLSERGHSVLRFNFVYTQAGRKAPDRMPKLLDCYRAIADEARATHPDLPLYLGGRSMGGRVASHLVADGYDAAGLVFMAYPLHPPGKPEKIRDEHLAGIKVPMLYLQGTSDPFATPELLDATIARLPNATLHRVDGGDHSFKVRGRKPAEINDELVTRIDQFVNALR